MTEVVVAIIGIFFTLLVVGGVFLAKVLHFSVLWVVAPVAIAVAILFLALWAIANDPEGNPFL